MTLISRRDYTIVGLLVLVLLSVLGFQTYYNLRSTTVIVSDTSAVDELVALRNQLGNHMMVIQKLDVQDPQEVEASANDLYGKVKLEFQQTHQQLLSKLSNLTGQLMDTAEMKHFETIYTQMVDRYAQYYHHKAALLSIQQDQNHVIDRVGALIEQIEGKAEDVFGKIMYTMIKRVRDLRRLASKGNADDISQATEEYLGGGLFLLQSTVQQIHTSIIQLAALSRQLPTSQNETAVRNNEHNIIYQLLGAIRTATSKLIAHLGHGKVPYLSESTRTAVIQNALKIREDLKNIEFNLLLAPHSVKQLQLNKLAEQADLDQTMKALYQDKTTFFQAYKTYMRLVDQTLHRLHEEKQAELLAHRMDLIWGIVIITLVLAALGSFVFILSHRRAKAHIEEVTAQREQLEVAKAEAEAANEAKSTFLANISHELRTPMHAILNFNRMACRRAANVEDEKLHKHLDRVDKSANRLLLLVNDLLDLTKFEQQKMVLNIADGPVLPMLTDAVDELQSLVDKKGMRVQTQYDFMPETIPCDSFRMVQVLVNVLSNAIKFSPPGSKIILVTQMGEVVGSDLPCLTIEVRDQGPGIPEDEMEQIFDEFVQSSSTSSGDGGTGLGLSICRHIMLLHRGAIFVQNLPDQGASFFIQLPLASEH